MPAEVPTYRDRPMQHLATLHVTKVVTYVVLKIKSEPNPKFASESVA